MPKPRRILFLIYDGFQILDMSGPASVFAAVNSLEQQQVYEIKAVSVDGGQICSSAGLKIASQSIANIKISASDSVLVVGAQERAIISAAFEPRLQKWLQGVTKTVERHGSICTGAFILAAAGLLDGREATTHWAGCKRLAQDFPSVSVKPDALYVTDGPLWTSAGVSTGIDMALEMVAHDNGRALMTTIAKWLVVYAHRPGNQSQFSSVLAAQTAADGMFAEVISWMGENLDKPIGLMDMAERAAMSERTFRRKFTDKIGTSPSKYRENLRLEKARQLLEAGQAVSAVALAIGYRSEAGFRTAFRGKFGITPSLHAALHADGGTYAA